MPLNAAVVVIMVVSLLMHKWRGSVLHDRWLEGLRKGLLIQTRSDVVLLECDSK